MKTAAKGLGFSLPVLCILVIFASGCAGGPASFKTLTPLSKDENLNSYTKLVIETKKLDNVSMTSADLERINSLVAQKVRAKNPNRFMEINQPSPDSNTLHTIITFTVYEEGNAFARAMLAGIGQIHIDAEVTLENRAKQATLSKHEVNKTFAWGGIYGGVTRISDVEHGFAEAVAAILFGEPPEGEGTGPVAPSSDR